MCMLNNLTSPERALFEEGFSFLMEHEGGTNFHVNDRGGLTKYGISQKQYPKLNIETLSVDLAKHIYLNQYWLKNKCNELSRPISLSVFDSGVNCGVQSGAIWLQKSLNMKGASLKLDGVIGPRTLHAAHACNPISVASKILSLRLDRYYKLTGTNPKQVVFIRGWMKRVSDLIKYAL